MTKTSDLYLFPDSKAQERWEEVAKNSLKGIPLEKVLNHATVEGVGYQGLYCQNKDKSKKLPSLYSFPQSFVSSRVYDSGLASLNSLKEDQAQGMQACVLMVKGKTWRKEFPEALAPSFILQKVTEEILAEFKGFKNVYVDCNKLDMDRMSSEIERVAASGAGFAINVSQIHNAGASAVQEISFGLNVFSTLLRQGVEPSRILFFVATDSLLFLNIAKVRALRFLAEEVLAAFDKKPEPTILAVSSLREQTLYDPWVNLLRNCASSMAAVLGGANQIAIRAHDSLFSFLTGEVSAESAGRSARHILNIIREEAKLDFVEDPAKGTFALEELTFELVEQSWSAFLNWEDKGLFPNIRDFSKAVEAISKARLEKARTRKKIVTGVSDFANPDETLESLYQKSWTPVYTSSGLFPLRRNAQDFEELRLALEKSEKKLKAALVSRGEPAALSARINFMKNVFETLGVEVWESPLEESLQESFAKAKQENCNVLLFCGKDEEYSSWLQPADKKQFKHQFIAGNKEKLNIERKEEFMDIFHGKDIHKELKNLLLEEGIL